MIFSGTEYLDVPAGVERLGELFEELEPGSGVKLAEFLREGELKYKIGMGEMVHKPGLSLSELIDPLLVNNVFRLHVFESISTYVRRFFKHPKLVQLLEFPILFLGAKPSKTPALYSLMNYADMALGTWYPQGGMHKVIEGMVKLARSLGVELRLNSEVKRLQVSGSKIVRIELEKETASVDYVVASADYHHVEQHLLPPTHRRYTASYWESRVLAPSSLIFFLGINKRIAKLLHHTLFFDVDFEQHASEIYDVPGWPTAPQFYVSCPSKTDGSVAPEGCENLFVLIPVAPGLDDGDFVRQRYFDMVIDRLERFTGEPIRQHIAFKRTYAHTDFERDYHAYKGNAYGLANTLAQTANLKPGILNKKVGNLFYTGQLTVPGPGVPPTIISGRLVAKELIKKHKEFIT
jgi:phytoene desaturase